MKTKRKKQNPLSRQIDVYGAITTPFELIRETLINFMWGLMGNSIVVFMTKEIDVMVFLNFVAYYLLISYIVNRDKYTTRLGRFIILPGSAAMGAFVGYKLANYVSLIV
jgi:hypothetical protein